MLVYLRGHWNGSGRIPETRRLESSRQAFDAYGLQALANRRKMAVLVTGSSSLAVTQADVSSVEEAVGARFARVYLAAHSGGYVGLESTLDAGLTRVDRLLMLDNFYFGIDLARRIGALTATGLDCDGYYTEHNRARYETRFQPNAQCRVENREDIGHDAAVNRCLDAYLDGKPCGIETRSGS